MPTLIFEDKFDTGGTWSSFAGTPVIGTDPVPVSASNSLQCNAIGDYVYWNIPDSGYTRCVFGVWLRFASLPVTTTTRVFKIDSGPSEGWMSITSGGRPTMTSDGVPSIAAFLHPDTMSTNTWYWAQLMYDVSANPWELRFKLGTSVASGTAAAAASNLNPGNFLLGNTVGGEAITVYYAHAKAGVASADDDWWEEPVAPAAATPSLFQTLGIG